MESQEDPDSLVALEQSRTIVPHNQLGSLHSIQEDDIAFAGWVENLQVVNKQSEFQIPSLGYKAGGRSPC